MVGSSIALRNGWINYKTKEGKEQWRSKQRRGRSSGLGGANRGGKIDSQNPTDQALEFSTAPRRSQRILSRLATLHPPRRFPRRCVNRINLNETKVESLSRDTAFASSRSSSPDSSTSTDPMNLIDNASIGSTVWSAATRENLLDLDNQCQEPQKSPEIAPSLENRQEKSQCVPEIAPSPENRQCLSSMTKYAEKLQKEIEEDPAETESSLDAAYTIVDGHVVKKEIAPLLAKILEKYGDITAESDCKPSDILSLSLESLCDIYTKLKQKRYSNITHIELDQMLMSVRAFELLKMKVGWLRGRLEYISETKTMSLDYLTVRKEKAAHDESVSRLEKELGDLEQKLLEEKAKADWSGKVLRETKSRVEILLNQPLVHGLLSGASDE